MAGAVNLPEPMARDCSGGAFRYPSGIQANMEERPTSNVSIEYLVFGVSMLETELSEAKGVGEIKPYNPGLLVRLCDLGDLPNMVSQATSLVSHQTLWTCH
jgi:hypothetical protein